MFYFNPAGAKQQSDAVLGHVFLLHPPVYPTTQLRQQRIIMRLALAHTLNIFLPRSNKEAEQTFTRGLYFLNAPASQFHHLYFLLKGRLDDAASMMT